MVVIEDGGVNPVCCGSDMDLLIPRKDDNLIEKHVPNVAVMGNKITVTVNHVMEKEHFIEVIMLETDKGFYTRYLNPNTVPYAEFTIGKDEKAIAAYEYCNIHRLFKKDIN